MRIGIGAKAGLTAGIILYVYTTILGILLVVWEPFLRWPLSLRWPLFLGYYHFVINYFFHLGEFFEQKIITAIIVEFCFLLWLIFITLVLGIGYALYDRMPIRPSIVKGLTYGILAWWGVTGAILYLLYPIETSIALFEIPAWLSYGLFLGKLYEVIPKEAKVGIISVIKIKKKLLFFIFLILAVNHLILFVLFPSPLRGPIHRLVLLIFRL